MHSDIPVTIPFPTILIQFRLAHSCTQLLLFIVRNMLISFIHMLMYIALYGVTHGPDLDDLETDQSAVGNPMMSLLVIDHVTDVQVWVGLHC